MATARKAVAFFVTTLALGSAQAQGTTQPSAASATPVATPERLVMCGACHGANGNSA